MALGIYEEHDSPALLDAARRGEIQIYDMVRHYRLLKRERGLQGKRGYAANRMEGQVTLN